MLERSLIRFWSEGLTPGFSSYEPQELRPLSMDQKHLRVANQFNKRTYPCRILNKRLQLTPNTLFLLEFGAVLKVIFLLRALTVIVWRG